MKKLLIAILLISFPLCAFPQDERNLSEVLKELSALDPDSGEKVFEVAISEAQAEEARVILILLENQKLKENNRAYKVLMENGEAMVSHTSGKKKEEGYFTTNPKTAWGSVAVVLGVIAAVGENNDWGKSGGGGKNNGSGGGDSGDGDQRGNDSGGGDQYFGDVTFN